MVHLWGGPWSYPLQISHYSSCRDELWVTAPNSILARHLRQCIARCTIATFDFPTGERAQDLHQSPIAKTFCTGATKRSSGAPRCTTPVKALEYAWYVSRSAYRMPVPVHRGLWRAADCTGNASRMLVPRILIVPLGRVVACVCYVHFAVGASYLQRPSQREPKHKARVGFTDNKRFIQ